MKVLSIDVGMKNLAYCLFECGANDDSTDNDVNAGAQTPESIMKQVSILAWDTVNLCDADAEKPIAPPTCSSAGCKFTAKFVHAATTATETYY